MNLIPFCIFLIIEGPNNTYSIRSTFTDRCPGSKKQQSFLINKQDSISGDRLRSYYGSTNLYISKYLLRNESEEKLMHDTNHSSKEENLNYVTDEDTWNMTVAISQSNTIGLDWVKVIETLQTSPNCSVDPLTIAYNSALSAAERNMNADLSLSILSEMKRSDKKIIDAVSYKCAILSCTKADRVKEAMELYKEMLESGLTTDHGTIRSLLWLLSRHGHGDFSLKLLETLKKIAYICNNKQILIQNDYVYTIESCIKTEMFTVASNIYQELKSLKSFQMTKHLFDSVMKICYHTSNYNLAIEVYSDIMKERTFYFGIAEYHILMNILLMNHQFEQINYIWKDILNSGITLDYTICNIALQSYSTSGNFEESLEILNIMEGRNFLSGNFQPYLLAIKSCEQCGEWKLATKILRMAQCYNGYCTIELYNAVLLVCSIAQEWETMLSLCEEIEAKSSKEMKDDGRNVLLQLNGDTIAYMMMCYYHTDEVKKLKSLSALCVPDTRLLVKIRNAIST
ncbi:pentatricopeptide repeat domain-containing protein [Theileria equi strain WA]|uniref:Pentatricopeptide repeat domain-containing protein n=1 Tax=Theileria equi strain WA TaxID=1537102 RepID=L0B1A2_THEEQ|nr:pentatricopeptide repeat domain-containing protein [Theileria equi strain WA]AFZ81647.1 pentatricopeptide repeat domain-containing protein [Theileria equi strain WA]|eukprot:XP_004831313.1 pentatricopeptide repeat domain-containing protein [Theileria equi strain WA]